MQEFTVGEAGDGPYGITTGPDGNLWCTLVHAGRIARLTPAGDVTLFDLDNRAAGPSVIVAGPDGALWFARFQDGRIGRITVDGELSSVAVPSPYGLAFTPDGALWSTELNADRVWRTPPGGGDPAPLDLGTSAAMPSMLAAGADGAVWCTLNQGNAIARVDAPAVFALPTPGAAPVGIDAAPDGTAWFVEIGAGQVGRITPGGHIEEYPLADRAARPHAIVADPAGGCWFTEWAGNRLGHISADGTAIRSFDLPAPGSEPHGLTIGPDGAVWVALEVGRVIRFSDPGA
ncbi:virginiamycin B lyase [Dactylosporangium matsuzakiense]|uniref:Virginiamycin B lyase n=2 Tax=Dactylosporangium matsuzakiense TaxID=53360 RepID=A0A9W6KPM3_9ACTN|nr:virginiamycin B lyase [Dactylosporangium matsuzakiense]GLL04983.1 virginiamycin B lyase [Dactylosporangium matsuzakiense]